MEASTILSRANPAKLGCVEEQVLFFRQCGTLTIRPVIMTMNIYKLDIPLEMKNLIRAKFGSFSICWASALEAGLVYFQHGEANNC